MALKGMDYNIDYTGSQPIIYWLANGETAERNKMSLKKKSCKQNFSAMC